MLIKIWLYFFISCCFVSICFADAEDDERIETIRKDLGYYKSEDKSRVQQIQERLEKKPIKPAIHQPEVFQAPPNKSPNENIDKVESSSKISPNPDLTLKPPIKDENLITHISIQSSSAISDNKLITFGQLFKVADVPKGYSIKALDEHGQTIPIQVDIKALHPDQSIRHAIISANLQDKINIIWLYKSQANKNQAETVSKQHTSSPLNAKLTIQIEGKNYTASLNQATLNCAHSDSEFTRYFCDFLAPANEQSTKNLKTSQPIHWLNGDIVKEIGIPAFFLDEDANPHPLLMARFFIRKYAGSNNVRLDVIVENTWTYKLNPHNLHYNFNLFINQKKVLSQENLTHYTHARWRKIFWTEKPENFHLKHDNLYLIQTKAIPNYDQTLSINEKILQMQYGPYAEYPDTIMRIGPATRYMPQPGAHRDIGPLPVWTVHYVLTMDERTKNTTLATGDMAGTWPVHYRDHNTDLPVSLVEYPYLSIHANKRGQGPHPVPFCDQDCIGPNTPDIAHQPSFAFVPYIVTGDYYYLEELQFWTNWNVFETEPVYRMLDQALVKWQQPRAQAWSLRTLGQTVYITPDNHPLKSYFARQLDSNLDWYTEKFPNNPSANKLGVFTLGGGSDIQPWMNDFQTWSFGYLADLGFSKAKPILIWSSTFLINRFSNPDFCWIAASRYYLKVKKSENDPYFTNFKDIYKTTVALKARICDAMPEQELLALPEPERSLKEDELMAECKCNSQQMVNSFYGTKAKIGQMLGHPEGDMGFPSNLQPALAILNDYNIPKAKESWELYQSRSVRPDFAPNPIWDIVPRPN